MEEKKRKRERMFYFYKQIYRIEWEGNSFIFCSADTSLQEDGSSMRGNIL